MVAAWSGRGRVLSPSSLGHPTRTSFPFALNLLSHLLNTHPKPKYKSLIRLNDEYRKTRLRQPPMLTLMLTRTHTHRFNPIAPTLMHRALKGLLSKHYDHPHQLSLSHPNSHKQKNEYSKKGGPTNEELDFIVETSNGDIRSAVMALEFACSDSCSSSDGARKRRGGGGVGGSRAL